MHAHAGAPCFVGGAGLACSTIGKEMAMDAVIQFVSYIIFLGIQGVMEHVDGVKVLFDLLFS